LGVVYFATMNSMKKYAFIGAALIAVIILFRNSGQTAESISEFHSEFERTLLKQLTKSLPHGTNELFIGSGACVSCHGSDPEGLTSVLGDGIDVNVVDDWRATMMANSAKDPFWRAKVSHEVIVNPGLQLEIETTCTKCHAPMGHFAAFHAGAEHYSIQDMLLDSLAMDGIGCVACHQLSPNGLGDTFSGDLHYDTNKVAYGPYISPLISPMAAATNYEPVYSTHVTTSELCAGCHTLITQTVDLSGVPTGDDFVEQATYHEWLNSVYNDEASCQSCHVPRIDGPVLLAAGFPFTEERSPFGQHFFVGANTYMVDLMKDNRVDLGIDASEANFDSVFARTSRLLKQYTLDCSVDLISRDQDTAFYQLSLLNKAGHKFPSGYPSRIAFVQFIVTVTGGDTIFASGLMDEEFRIVNRDIPYEEHYDVIRQADQVQIYEMVMGDVNDNPTTVLERAKYPLKDNRLVPIGFTDYHPSYDTTIIAGAVLSDMNFNRDGKLQGLGSDKVHYNIALNGYAGDLTATAKVYYQSLPPDWMDEMFAETSEEIDYFKSLYDSKSPIPFLIDSLAHFDVSTDLPSIPLNYSVQLAQTGNQFALTSPNALIRYVSIYNASGKLIQRIFVGANQKNFTINAGAGMYLCLIEGDDWKEVKKVMVVY
jgi:hypothetical protein